MRYCRTPVFLGLLMLAGCDHRTSGQRALDEAQARHNAEFPIGRYQASQDMKGDGVYVLDTATGAVRFCVASTASGRGGDGFASVGVGCTPPSLKP